MPACLRGLCVAFVMICCLAAPRAHAQKWLDDWRYLPLTRFEQNQQETTVKSLEFHKDNVKFMATRRAARVPEVFTDRNVYLDGDGVGHIVANTSQFKAWGDAAALRLILRSPQGAARDALTVPLSGATATPKVAVRLATDKLPPGKYSVAAQVLLADGQPVGEPAIWPFERSSTAAPGGKVPAEGVPLMVGAMPAAGSGGGDTWPISTGVPLPRGAVSDVSRLALLENGKPVPAQWTVRSRWSPAEDAEVRWAGLDFVARYDNGKPREYRFVVTPQSAPAAATLATEHADRIEVDTGPLRFVVRKRGFNGIAAAWLDGEQVVSSEGQGAGEPFIVDDAGRRHAAEFDPDVQVTVEEQGPVRVVIAARGWYVAKEAGAPRMCRFVTHFTAYAGVPAVFTSQRTIIAYDTRTAKLADVGFNLPLRQADRWATGIDGKAHAGAMPKDGAVWLHQFRDDRVRLMEDVEGKRADGWLAATSSGQKGATVLCTLRDIWQKFPKELEASRDALTLHFWPRHGQETFSEQEQIDVKQIMKIRFAHQGQLLDLQLPERYYEVLRDHHATTRWDPENTAPIGFASTAEGVAIGNDFALWFLPADTDSAACAAAAERFQDPPHALADPAWNVAAGVEAPMSARDEARWPLAERTLNHDFPTAMFNLIDHVGAYGMWIYANTFNGFREDWPDLHRVWQNSHYQHVGEVWKLYFRGASPDVLRWARAQSQHHLNIGTVHHAFPDADVPGRQVGAMYHTKGFVPWGARRRGQFPRDADVRNAAHFVDPDAHLWRYLLEGDLFARDVYHNWVASIGNGNYPTHGPGREAINSVAMLHNAYAMTWDPQFVLQIRRGLEITFKTPLEEAKTAVASFPVWNKRWADRYHTLTRDQRVVGSIASYVRAGHRHWAPSAFAYRHLRDKDLLEPLVPGLHDLVRSVYRHEGDPFDGWGDWAGARRQEYMVQLPELMNAFNEAGISESDLAPPVGFYPPGDLLVLNNEGRDFSLKLEMPAMSGALDHLIRVIAPSGKVVRTVLIGRADVLRVTPDETTISLERQRFVGANVQQVAVPVGGEKGVFTVRLTGSACQLAAPATDLPHEAAVLTKEKGVRPGNRFVGVLAAPAEGDVQVTVNAVGYGRPPHRRPDAVYTRVGGSATPLLENSLLHIGAYKETSIALPAATTLRVQPFMVLGEAAVTWTGDAKAVLLAPRAEDAKAILNAMP